MSVRAKLWNSVPIGDVLRKMIGSEPNVNLVYALKVKVSLEAHRVVLNAKTDLTRINLVNI